MGGGLENPESKSPMYGGRRDEASVYKLKMGHHEATSPLRKTAD